MLSQKYIGIIVLLVGLLCTSCAEKEQFIFTSDEDGVICSAKSTFNDTIFYENRFPDSTIYYYAVLSKSQNEDLKKLIRNLKTEKNLSQFEVRPGNGTFTVVSDAVHFYEVNFFLPSSNVKNILTLFQEKGPHMEPCKKVDDFWYIDGVTPPDNPEP